MISSDLFGVPLQFYLLRWAVFIRVGTIHTAITLLGSKHSATTGTLVKHHSSVFRHFFCFGKVTFRAFDRGCILNHNKTPKFQIGYVSNSVILILFYCFVTVSKSLLTVLGTSPGFHHRQSIVASGLPYLSRSKNALDKHSPLARIYLPVAKKTPVAMLQTGVDFIIGVAALPANNWPWKAKPQKAKPFAQGLDFTSRFPPPGMSYSCHSARRVPLAGRSNGADRAAKACPIRYPFFKRHPAPGPARRPSGGAPHVRSVRMSRSRPDSVYVRIRATIQLAERGS